MPYTLRRSIVIRASPEQVFDDLLDISAHREWGEMTELELLFEGPAQVGSRWRSAGASANMVMRDDCTVTVLERPRLFSFQVRSQSQAYTAVITLSYRLEPEPGGTRVTWSREYDRDKLPGMMRAILSLPGFENVVVRLIDNLVTAKIVDRGLVRLRDRLERAYA